VSSPWRADVLHNEKLQAETQSRRVGENRKEVHEIYKNFVNHEYSADETVGHLQSLGIEPTHAFQRLLQESSACAEIKFADFTRALVVYDPRNTYDMNKRVDMERPAGAPHTSMRPQVTNVPQVDAELFPQFKRKNPAVANAATLTNRPPSKEATHDPTKLRTGKKITLEIDPRTGQVSSKFKSSHEIRKAAFDHDNYDSADVLMSHSKLDQQTGVIGDEVPIRYTSELKLLREQVLAALRKLDSGEVSLSEFQDKVFDMGFELPEVIVKELRRSAHSGMMNWKKCVEILDAEVFKSQALYDRVPQETVDAVKEQLLAMLLAPEYGGGANALSNLATAFRKMDTNGDGALSLNELKAGFQSYHGSGVVSDEDIRILFNAFDTSGDGFLSLTELLEGLRGAIPPQRLSIIRTAYQRLNRTGKSVIPLETVTSAYDASYHPDVVSGLKTERQVVNELCTALTQYSQLQMQANSGEQESQDYDGTVSRESFEEFFGNLSASIDSDEEFSEFMKKSFNINYMKAPPALQVHIAITKRCLSSGQIIDRLFVIIAGK
jgi:Ca2+-binding EF-hand superfamily protein